MPTLLSCRACVRFAASEHTPEDKTACYAAGCCGRCAVAAHCGAGVVCMRATLGRVAASALRGLRSVWVVRAGDEC